MGGFRFGLLDGIVNSRFSPTVLPRVASLTAAATGADSFWVGDHLNSLMPRSIATPEYLGVGAKLVPKVDAILEPWTMLGHLAAGTGSAGCDFGVVCDRRQSPQSSGHGAGGRDSASAYPRPCHPRYRCRGT